MLLLDRIGLRRTREKLQSCRVSGSAVILASAPGAVLPAAAGEPASLFCVNASGRSAHELGLSRPSVTVISGRMLGDREANREGQEAIAGLETETCIVIERGIEFGAALDRLDELGYRFGDAVRMTHRERRRIVRAVFGEDLAAGGGEGKISTGLFTVALALFLGARPAVLAGFSLSRDGHAYSASNLVRQHKAIDAAAIDMLLANGSRVATADPALHEETGMPLIG